MGLPPRPWPQPPPVVLTRWALHRLYGLDCRDWGRELHVRAIAALWCWPMPEHAEPGPWLLACAEVATLDPDDPLPRLLHAARAAP